MVAVQWETVNKEQRSPGRRRTREVETRPAKISRVSNVVRIVKLQNALLC